MTLQQLRFLCQIVESGFNVTRAAEALHTSQSGVSHQIRLLERELSATILVRQGKRILGLTDVGKGIANASRDILLRAAQLKSIAADLDPAAPSQLTVATTHVHARYALLPIISHFAATHRTTALHLIQTFPSEIFELLDNDKVDLGLTTESAPDNRRFDTVPAYLINRILITPVGHPLLKQRRPSLKDIARHPMIVYDSRLTSGRTVDEAFERIGVTPYTVLRAVDVDVIKAYVSAGLGVAIIPSLAFEAKEDIRLRALSLGHIMPGEMTHIVTRRGKYLRTQARAFIQLLQGRASR